MACLRDRAKLVALPDEELGAWTRFWLEVEEVREQARR